MVSYLFYLPSDYFIYSFCFQGIEVEEGQHWANQGLFIHE